MAPCITITGVSAHTAKISAPRTGATQRSSSKTKKIATMTRMILRVIPANGGNDNIIELDRGIFTSVRVPPAHVQRSPRRRLSIRY